MVATESAPINLITFPPAAPFLDTHSSDRLCTEIPRRSGWNPRQLLRNRAEPTYSASTRRPSWISPRDDRGTPRSPTVRPGKAGHYGRSRVALHAAARHRRAAAHVMRHQIALPASEHQVRRTPSGTLPSFRGSGSGGTMLTARLLKDTSPRSTRPANARHSSYNASSISASETVRFCSPCT